MSLRKLDLFGVIGLLGVVSVLRAFISRHPRLPRERRKKERKKEREKERKKERYTYPYISFTYISLYPYEYFFVHFPSEIFSPFFFGGFFTTKNASIEYTLNKEGGDRHACLDERRCGTVQAHWGKCRRQWTTLRGVSSKASRRCRDKRDSMHARQEAAEKRRVRV